MKIKKTTFFEGVGSGGGGFRLRGGQGRCEQSSKVFVKIQKNIYFVLGGVGSWGSGSGGGGGFRVDVNEELKFL